MISHGFVVAMKRTEGFLYPFPLRLLAKAQCYPTTQRDCDLILETHSSESRPDFRGYMTNGRVAVHLTRNYEGGKWSPYDLDLSGTGWGVL